MNSNGGDTLVSPGELPAVATEDQLANQLRRVVTADSVVSPPDDPLYDSSRDYLDTVARAKRASNDGTGGEQ